MESRGRLSRAGLSLVPFSLKSQIPFTLLSLKEKYFMRGLS